MTNIHLSTVSPFFFRDPCESGSQFAFHRGDTDHVGERGGEKGMRRGGGKEIWGGEGETQSCYDVVYPTTMCLSLVLVHQMTVETLI